MAAMVGDILVNSKEQKSYMINHTSKKIFSISPEVVVSEKSFSRLNDHMRNKWGMTVEEVPYSEISKMEGLLCMEQIHTKSRHLYQIL